MAEAPITAAALAAKLKEFRLACGDERQLQEAIAIALQRSGLRARREVTIGSAGRIDFVVEERIGVEVKVDGTAFELASQASRYLKSGLLDELLVVTTRHAHRGVPSRLVGKTVGVLVLHSGFA